MEKISRPLRSVCLQYSLLPWQLSCRHSSYHNVAIVGSGPAGFYTAQQLLKLSNKATVDIYEKLPVPYGLVRFGVAPDHQDVKNVINKFNSVASNSRVNFYGNVHVGRDITVKQLCNSYHSVILAYGSDEDKKLGIPGEHLTNVISARQFVGWYNGLPQHQNLTINLSNISSVCVLGLGNVALDVARILLSPIDKLKKTDLTTKSLDCLASSAVTDVHLVGRRGPLQTAFTTAELREMIKLKDCVTLINQGDFQGYSEIIYRLDRPRKRLLQLMLKSSHTNLESVSSKKCYLKFCRSPVEFHSNENEEITSVDFVINKLKGNDILEQVAVPTVKKECMDTQLVIKSIGYKCIPIDKEIPFDNSNGIIPNAEGRVLGFPGLYCSGWVKRGPVGVIVSTMNDAFQTANVVAQDLNTLPTDSSKEGGVIIKEVLLKQNIPVVSFNGWQKIDNVEVERGRKEGKPREKITDIKEMLAIALS